MTSVHFDFVGTAVNKPPVSYTVTLRCNLSNEPSRLFPTALLARNSAQKNMNGLKINDLRTFYVWVHQNCFGIKSRTFTAPSWKNKRNFYNDPIHSEWRHSSLQFSVELISVRNILNFNWVNFVACLNRAKNKKEQQSYWFLPEAVCTEWHLSSQIGFWFATLI